MKLIYKFVFTLFYTTFYFVDAELKDVISDDFFLGCFNESFNDTKLYILDFSLNPCDYVRIINFYGNLTLYNGSKKYITTLDDGEKEFNYRKETAESKNYINFTAPSPPGNCCFLVMTDIVEHEEVLSFLSEDLNLYLFKEREFNITIQNQKKDSKYISLYFEILHTNINSVNVTDNEITFVPIYEEIEENNKFYIVFYLYFVRDLSFNIALYNNQTSISNITITEIHMSNVTIENITEEGLFCSNRSINFYQMVNSNAFGYYLISFKNGTEIYFYKNNTDIEQINSGEIGKIINDSFYSNRTKGLNCFYIKYTDEKNSLKEKGDFNITLFGSSSYNFTIINDILSIKSIQIKFKEDEYFNISKFFYNNIEINSYLFEDYYYYHFEHKDNETPIHLKFQNMSNIDSVDYHEVQLSYKPLKYTLTNISKDYEEKLTKEIMYKIQPQDKKEIYIAHNSLNPNYFKINGKNQNNNSFWINVTEPNYLYANGTTETPLLFTLTYFEKEIIDLNLNNNFSFKLITNQILKFNLTVINNYFNVTLRIHSNNSCMNSNITLEGAVSESNQSSIINATENTTIIIKGDVVLAEIEFSLTNSAEMDDITISYDYQSDFESINGSYFFNNQTEGNYYRLFPSENNIYYEIINYYGSTLLFLDYELIYNLTGGEKSYCFTYDKKFNYILRFSSLDSHHNSAFQIVCSNEERNILTSSLDLYFFKEREFELIVKNEEEKQKYFSLFLEINISDGILFNSSNATENEEYFTPIYEEINNYIIFYLYLDRNITFKPILFNNQSEITNYTKTTINLTDLFKENISNTRIICSDRSISFYQMSSLKNYFGYYLISFKNGTELYFYKNNTNKEQINSGKIGKITNVPFYFDTSKGGKYFYIKYTDGKNSIEEGDFNITLFESSSYNFTIIDENIKSIQIIFKEDIYYNISNFTYQDIEIKYLYKDEDNYYLYFFNHTDNEASIHLKFENISSIDSLNYHEVQLSYKPVNYYLKNITNDYEEKLTKEQMYKINPQAQKPKVYIAQNSSDSNNFKINGKRQKNNSFWIDVNENDSNYIYAQGQEDNPLFFTLIYLEKEIIDLNLNNNFSFTLITNQIFKFNFTDLSKDHDIVLHIDSKNKSVNVTINLTGAISESNSSLIIRAGEYTPIIIVNYTNVSAEIGFSLINSSDIGNIIISYNYNYTKIIGSNYTFFDKPTYSEYRLLPSEDNIYYEIINYYGNILLYSGKQIIKNLTGEEESFFFEYTNSNYILIFNTSKTNQKSGFQIVCSNKERANILTSFLVLYLFQKREFNLTVKNIESKTIRLVSIEIIENIDSSDKIEINSVNGIENGESFTPFSDSKYYYLILDNNKNLTFKMIVSNINSELIKPISFEINLKGQSITNITKSGIIYPKEKFTFYNILNSEDSKNYYSLYFKSDSEIDLYNFESNANNSKKAISNKSKKISDYELLYYNYSKSQNVFHIDFQDENNSKEEGNFSIILYEPIQYYFTLVNKKKEAKRIQIKYKKNDYNEIDYFKVLMQEREIKYLFLDSDKYYVYQFNKTSDEIPIIFVFSKLKEFQNWIEIDFNYQSFNNNMIEINNDIQYNCITFEKMYKITDGDKKYYFEVIHNTSSKYVIINGKPQTSQINLISSYILENSYLNILGSPEKKICYQITFYESSVFHLESGQELNFTILMTQDYSLIISDLLDNDIDLYIKTENNNLELVNLYIDTATKELRPDEYGLYKCRLHEPSKRKIQLRFVPKYNIDKEKVTIYYNLIKKTDVFVSVVCYYTYTALGLFVLSLIYYAIEKSRGKSKKEIHISYFKVFKRFGNLCKIRRKNNQLNKLF